MKRYLITAAVLCVAAPAYAAPKLGVCHNEYALCAASSTEATGKTMVVGGKTFLQGHAVCPVLKGESIADMHLIGSCNPPAVPGGVWSLFSTATSYPQAPSWAVVTAVPRTFTTAVGRGLGMSNMWSYPCVKRAKPVNGAVLADCIGPINESPWDGGHVLPGSSNVTAAPVGASDPVGGNY